MKSTRDVMDIVNVYADVGSYRAAAALCHTTHKTVKRIVERRQSGTGPATDGRRVPRPRNTEGVRALIAERVHATDGRISAKRLLPVVEAAGYHGSARSLRRAVAEAKAAWRRERRTYRPWVPVPGEHLVIDWGSERGLHLFCAVLPWSRYRFVRMAADERRTTTLALLAECFEELGGVPAVVLADRMACLKTGTVANVVVPHPDYVQLAAQYGFRPDFCEARDPESKGVVETLVGYAQTDLVVPAGGWESLAAANDAARAWCAEVNGRMHTEIAAIPAARLATERGVLRPLPTLRAPLRTGEARKVDKLATIRFGAARYSVPRALVGVPVQVVASEGTVVITHEGQEVARHRLVAPGEVALNDAHYGGPARRPARAVRPRSAAELAFLALGPAAERFLRAAAAAGTARLSTELAAIVALEPAWGRAALLPALERAVTFHRFTAADVRAILEAGPGVPTPTPPGSGLARGRPARSAHPRPERLHMGGPAMSAPTPLPLAPDLEAGLRRLKLATIRSLAPEVLQTAKTQRWTPEEVLRTFIEAEIAARDAANEQARLRAAHFPVLKTLDEFQVAQSAVPPATFAYLSSLEWLRAAENLCLVGPSGTGKSHLLLALGAQAVRAGLRVRYFGAASLIEALYRGLADNSVGRLIEQLLRHDLLIIDELGFAPLDPVGTQLLFRVVAAAYERRSVALASHWPFERWGHFLPEEATAVALLDRLLHHAVVVVTAGESFRMRDARTRRSGGLMGAPPPGAEPPRDQGPSPDATRAS